MSTLRRVLCAVLGGHDFGWPRLIDGRMRQRCMYGCGALTKGWPYGPQIKKALVFPLPVIQPAQAARKRA